MNYSIILDKTITIIKQQKSQANTLTYIRLLLALVVLFSLYQYFGNGSSTSWIIIGIIGLFTFLFFVNYHQQLLEKIRYNQMICMVCQRELAAATGNIDSFDTGKAFENKTHPFSFDLDIFGEKSLFQLLCRCFTTSGKEKLAQQLSHPFLQPNEILLRQAAMEELKNKLDWRVNFLTTGNLLQEDDKKFGALLDWLHEDTEENLINFNRFKGLLWLVPLLNIGVSILLAESIIPFKIWVLIIILPYGIALFVWKKMNLSYRNVNKYAANLKKYTQLCRLIENEKFETNLLKNYRQSLINPKPISDKIQQLVTISKYFDVRNTLFGPLLNIFFIWDLQCAYRFEGWKKQNSQVLAQVFDILYEMEVLISVACYAYANNDCVMPELIETMQMRAIELGHPLINKKKSVCNNFEINNREQFFIVTGANMAGKSTFLRAVGANITLAMIGAPVFARKFIFKPMQVFTCMRITDSIGEGESYFYAELERLQRIVQLLEEGKEVFVILDELLKGTNSRDKLLGSELFLEKLLSYKNAVGLIATHDLDLTKMAIKYPVSIKNICFEILIDGDKMNFDYKLREGVTQNMNALLLMREMRII